MGLDGFLLCGRGTGDGFAEDPLEEIVTLGVTKLLVVLPDIEGNVLESIIEMSRDGDGLTEGIPDETSGFVAAKDAAEEYGFRLDPVFAIAREDD